MKGVTRLLVVIMLLWLIAVCATAWRQYSGPREGIFVSVHRHPVGLQSYQISNYREQLRKQLVDANRDYGENVPVPRDDRYAAAFEALDRKAQKRAALINDALSMIPRKQLPFTDDYVRQIARTANLPTQVVTTHPRKAEKIYRLLQLEWSWQRPFMEKSSTEVRFLPISFVVIAFGVPAVIIGLCFIAFRTVAWVLAAFRSSD